MRRRITVVDAHLELWKTSLHPYPRMAGSQFDPIPRDFTLEDVRPWLAIAGVDYIVLVQTLSSVEETRELLQIAETTAFVAGVVGWVDLTHGAVGETLAALKGQPDGKWLVGVRHPVLDEADPEWLLRTDVQRGLEAVRDVGLVYDFHIRPRELPAALATAHAIPDMRFVIDYLAKPAIAPGKMAEWAALLEPFRHLPHVTCKLSGMLREAGWTEWTPVHLRPYLLKGLDIFGIDRVMFGSDWPASLPSGEYGGVKQALEEALPRLPLEDWTKVFGGNAIQQYRLDIA